MKVIIAGGRYFDDYDLLEERCDYFLKGYIQKGLDVEIVSGTAKGADTLGERYAHSRGYAVKEFPADWDNLGKKAGYVRNEQMAKYAHALIAFWNGSSRGTKHMIDLAQKHGLEVRVVKYEGL